MIKWLLQSVSSFGIRVIFRSYGLFCFCIMSGFKRLSQIMASLIFVDRSFYILSCFTNLTPPYIAGIHVVSLGIWSYVGSNFLLKYICYCVWCCGNDPNVCDNICSPIVDRMFEGRIMNFMFCLSEVSILSTVAVHNVCVCGLCMLVF